MVVNELGIVEAELEDGLQTSFVILFTFRDEAAYPTLPYIMLGMIGMGDMPISSLFSDYSWRVHCKKN